MPKIPDRAWNHSDTLIIQHFYQPSLNGYPGIILLPTQMFNR